MTLTPERLAELQEQGVVLAHIDLLRTMEHEDSPPVTMRARPNDDGTWELICTRHTCLASRRAARPLGEPQP